MSFINKTQEEIKKEIFEIGTQNTGVSNFKPGGVLRGIWETMAVLVFQFYSRVINVLYRNLTWETAIDFWLDLHGMQLGVVRKSPTKAKGFFKCSAYNGGTVKKGLWIKTASGSLRYKVSTDTGFVSGEFLLPVEAEFVGSKYNIIPGAEIRFSSTVFGIDAVYVPDDWTTIPGTDKEGDDSYRARIAARWAAQGDDNRPAKYESLARTVSGVQDIKVVRAPRGPGSVNVVVSAVDGLPSSVLLDSVRAAIDSSRLVARDTLVLGFTPVYTDFVVKFLGNCTAADVENELRSWVLERKIGEGITVEQLYKESLKTLNLSYIYFESPTEDMPVLSTGKNLIQSLTAAKEA